MEALVSAVRIVATSPGIRNGFDCVSKLFRAFPGKRNRQMAPIARDRFDVDAASRSVRRVAGPHPKTIASL